MKRFVLTLLIGVLFVASPVGAAAPRIALVVGNSNYTEAPLPNPVNDTRLVAATLSSLGFQVDLQLDADQKTMKFAIVDFGERLSRAGKDAVGLLFYAGHGLQVSGENYRIPLAANIIRESHVAIEAVSAGWVLGEMEFAGNAMNFVILDACRNNPLSRGFRSTIQGLARMDAPRGSIVAHSTAPGQVARDGLGVNSPYTTALVREMRAPGTSVEHMFKQVRVAVMADTDDQQVPWESSSLTGDFFFVPGQVSAETEQSVAAPSSLDNAEQAFWQAIKDSDSAYDYQAYLDAYPTGIYAALARARASALQAASANQATRDTAGSDLAFWDAIKDSTNPADFAAYPQQFPNGTFAPLAQVRLAAAEESAKESAEEALWRSVEASGRVQNYQAYISAYPLGKHTEVARIKMMTAAQSNREVTPTTTEVAVLTTRDNDKPWNTANEIRAKLIDNGAKLTGLSEGRQIRWRQAYDEGGCIRGMERSFPYFGRWWFEGDLFCADLDGTDSDGCWYLAIDGERTRWWDRNGRIDSGGNEVTYVAP